MNKRKIIGTIVGALIWACCVVFFTYAYYNWQSENTIVSLTIQDSSTTCILGPNVEVENIGPVLNYQDGVKAEFEVENISDTNSTTGVTLDITSISETLLVDSFKYKLVQDVEGSTNYDYENPVAEGDFSEFVVGSNVIKSDVIIAAGSKYSFLFVVYIDGSMHNDVNMQVNSMNANLSLGGCSESVQGEAIYTVAYDCNGGTGTMENSTHVYDVDKNLTSNSCVKVGYNFAGWATSQNGEVVYSNRQLVKNLTNIHRDTVTLYAKWSVNVYNVSFVGNKFGTVNQTVNGVDVTYEQTTSVLTLDGTQEETIPLMNWGNQSFAEGEQYQFTAEYISGSYNCTSNATLATEIRNSSNSSLGLAHFHLPTTGSATATVDVTADMASNGKILYTQIWLDEANTMTFSDYKVKVTLTKVENSEVAYDGIYGTLPSNPTRYGYNFLGWYTSETGGSKIETTSKPELYEEHTIYARWSPKSPKVLLVGNGGTISSGKTMTNLIKDGSFENGGSDWTLSNASITTEQAYDGSHSAKLSATSTAMTRQNLPYTAPTFNHYYYGRTMFLSSSDFSANDARFEWFYTDATGGKITFFDKKTATTSWKLLSSVKNLTSTTSYLDKSWYFRNFTVAGTSASYVDSNMVIDLTETFGSGSEITDTTLLDTIPYFESTMSLKLEDVTYASSYGDLPTPTRSEYNFLGWYTEMEGGSQVTDETIVTLDSEHTLYARWQQANYTIGDIYYETLQEAISAASNSDEIKLMRNLTDSSTASISKTITLNTNGYTLTRSDRIIVNSNGNLTIAGSGTLQSPGTTQLITNNGTLNITHTGTIQVTNTSYDASMFIANNGTLNKTGSGTIKSYGYTIYGGTVNVSAGTVQALATDDNEYEKRAINAKNLTISGGTISGATYGTASSVSTTVTGGTISGTYGVRADAGTIDIKGGTISGTSYGVVVWGTNEVAITIGDISTGSSTTTPSVSGGTLGVYAPNLTWNFYNGVIKGTNATPYNGTPQLRDGQVIRISSSNNIYSAYLDGAKYCTITIANNNNSYGTVSTSSVSVLEGTTYTTSVVDANNGKITFSDGTEVTATATAATGYTTTFSSWSSTSGTITGATTITANFTRTGNKYTVTLNNQSATSAGTTSVSATYGSAMPSITKPSRAYTVTYNTNGGTVNTNSATATYTFDGYYDGTSGSGTQYYNANGDSARTWNKTAATTLYANWTSDSVKLPAPIRSNYAFAAWYTSASGGTKVANSGASYTPTKNITLYAQWVSVSIAANKKTAETAVKSGAWSSEGLNFTFTASGQTTGATIQYCKDTNNTCTPGTTATSGTAVTSYNKTTGTYYIRYRVKGASGGTSTIQSYTAKVDTTTPTITMTASRHDIYDTENVYSTSYGPSGGTTTCINTSYNNRSVTTYTSINMLGTHAIKCTAKSNAGLTATKTVNYEIAGTFNASNGLSVTGGNGYVSGTSIVLDQNAVQYGPYKWALAGCYYVWYFGNNLHVYPEGYYAYNTIGSVGTGYFNIYNLNYLSNQANYYLSIPNTTDTLELLRSNGTTTNITIDYVHIYPVAWSYCA